MSKFLQITGERYYLPRGKNVIKLIESLNKKSYKKSDIIWVYYRKS